MPYDVSWLLENRIIYSKNTGEISESDSMTYDQLIVDFYNRSTAPLVHLILDVGGLEKLPSFKSMRNMESLKHPRCGWILPVGAKINPVVNMVGTITFQLFKIRMRQFKTVEEALEFLQYVDTTLPDLKALNK